MNRDVSILQSVLEMESQALLLAKQRLGQAQAAQTVQQYTDFVAYLKDVGAALFFCGVGKSGLIAQKLASTFASLGMPSFYLHPVEALHGDLGRMREGDGIVFLSKSGTTEEIIKLLPYLNIKKERRIGLLGNLQSPIAEACAMVFDCSVEKEACLNNQAPTTSTTLAMAMGDALAVLYESIVDLSKEKFAVNHPGGLLGKSLTMRVESLMWKQEGCPKVKLSATFQEALLEMTRHPAGGCAVVDDSNKLLGILVEGDVRRVMTGKFQGLATPIKDIYNAQPITIAPETLAYEALKRMENRNKPLNILPVVDSQGIFLGLLRLHDLLKEGFILNS